MDPAGQKRRRGIHPQVSHALNAIPDWQAGFQRKLAKIKERKTLLTAHQIRCQGSPTRQVNLTDPDARQLNKSGKSTVGYSVQAAVDAKHHLIAPLHKTDTNGLYNNNRFSHDPAAIRTRASLVEHATILAV